MFLCYRCGEIQLKIITLPPVLPLIALVPHSNITLLFRFSAIAYRVTLVSRVTALQNNIVGYVPPFSERSCSKCVCLSVCRAISSLTLTYTTPDSGLTYTNHPCSRAACVEL